MSDQPYLAVVRYRSDKPAAKFTFKSKNDASAIEDMRKACGVRDTLDLHSYQLMRVNEDSRGIFYILVAEKYESKSLNTEQKALPAPEEKSVIEERSYTPYVKIIAA